MPSNEEEEQPVTRSSPRRTARSSSTPESKKPQKKPVSILKSKRYGISVQPDSDNDDEFPSDSPFFKAAQEAVTQEGINQSGSSGDESEVEDQVDVEVLKFSRKQKRKKDKLNNLKEQYMEDLATGVQTPEVLKGRSGADASLTDESGEWARKAYASAHRTNKNSILMSPSELSPASTVAATPASQRSTRSDMTPNGRTILDEVLEGDEFEVNDDDDDDVPQEEVHVAASESANEHAKSVMEASEPDNEFLGAGNDDDDDNEGEGFQLNADPNLSDDGDEKAEEESNEEQTKLKKKKKKDKKSLVTPDNRETGKKRGRPKKVKISSNVFNVGHQVGNRDYIQVPIEELDAHSCDEEATRHSKRKRIAPLAFWKNERPIYAANNASGQLAEVFGDMPFVSGVQKALPTPYKKRSAPQKKKKKYESDSDDDSEPKSKHGKSKSNGMNDQDIEEFDTSIIEKKYKINDGEIASVWDEANTESVDMSECTLSFSYYNTLYPYLTFFFATEVFCYKKKLTMHSLPLIGGRKKSEGNITGKAAQAFNKSQEGMIPNYIVGCLELPPRGIKDPESVGPCCQIFNVGDCQPKSVEISIANPDVNNGNYDEDSAQRFLLSKNDSFHLPPGNVYRIQNHSKTTTCTLHWTIIQPLRQIE